MFRWRHNVRDNREQDVDYQEEKIQELKAAIGPLSGRSSKFCTDSCFRRYLVARSWNIVKAKKMLEETLEWRATYKPEEIRWREIASEGETGKVYRANFHDREGRAVIVMRPAKQNSSSRENQIRHLVYNLENAILNLPEGLEQMVWLIDFTGWSLSNAVPIKTAQETAYVLQNHYPERLGAAFLYNPPRIFEAFAKVVKYFLDPITLQKLRFIYPKNEVSMDAMRASFGAETLPVEFGGENPSTYDHEEFSRMMEEDELKAKSTWELDGKSCNVK